jgi:hypothetical protein
LTNIAPDIFCKRLLVEGYFAGCGVAPDGLTRNILDVDGGRFVGPAGFEDRI